jgi:hypothetical protein
LNAAKLVPQEGVWQCITNFITGRGKAARKMKMEKNLP